MGIAPSVERFEALEGYATKTDEERLEIIKNAGLEITKYDATISKFLGLDNPVFGAFIRGIILDSKLKCEGCNKNISKGKNKEDKKECLIYLANEESRLIKERKEGEFIKPYESMKDICFKNNLIKEYNREEELDKIYNEQIELVDNMVGGDKEIIEIIKNNIMEEEGETRYLIIECYKNKYKLNKKKEKIIDYSIVWVIRDRHNDVRTEKKFFARTEVRIEDIYKIILRSMILGYILLGRNTKILLGIDKNIQTLIKNFKNERSTRRRLDNEYYMELIFLEKKEKEKNLIIDILSWSEGKNIKEESEIIKKQITNMKKIDRIEIIFNDESFIVNEYNLYWNYRLIFGNYRGWQKKMTEVKWKNEILNSKKIEDLFYYNFKNEFDWVTSLKFISNRNKCSFWQTNVNDTKDRAYKIKNLIKELPTYEVLKRRNVEDIEEALCPRCNETNEDWKHIWICEKNEKNLNVILEESVIKYRTELEKSDKEKFEFFMEIEYNFLNILYENSSILHNQSRIWELLRGVFNNKFYDLGKKKFEKDIIIDFWSFCYDQIRKEIWIKRCDEVAKIETNQGFKKKDKRKRKERKNLEIEERDRENKKLKKIEKEIKNQEKIIENSIKLATSVLLKNNILDKKSISDKWGSTMKKC
ncbi:hypothetical protein RhiirC2_790546 [Rhizophagus irregularis]|uniref:Uncharacterized protein n=1 Tax=Rhizophagus irregularis TaxID=588596 RepID=A0A2N1MKZ8_9GLOM|nr:hypothetical protein RhiirC2_790546 [Rhizophagus irregularis]